MKRFTRVLLALAVTSATAVSMASAQPLITVDELGNGNINGNPLPAFLNQDPVSGMVTLTYRLPFPGVPGDVLLFEPGTPAPNPPSDLVRFDGQGFLYFFSEREATDTPPFDPADVGVPPPIPGLQTVILLEAGPEGNNGVFYNPVLPRAG